MKRQSKTVNHIGVWRLNLVRLMFIVLVSGLGWRLQIPKIQRQTDKGMPTYSQESDTFVYKKEELVQLSGDSYRVENESGFDRLIKNTCGWIGQQKNGVKLKFGYRGVCNAVKTPDSDYTTFVPDKPPVFQYAFSWLISEMVDVNGNVILFSYNRYSDSPGVHYLNKIQYGFQGDIIEKAYHAIKFNYDKRPDIYSRYNSGFEQKTARRLKKIQTLTQIDPSEVVAPTVNRQYHFSYKNDAISAVSLLQKIQQTDAQNNPLPPYRFDYYQVQEDINNHWPVQSLQVDMTAANSQNSSLADINSDGLTDIVMLNGLQHQVALNLGQGKFSQPIKIANAHHASLAENNIRLFDIDGDGEIELVKQVKDGDIPRFWYADLTKQNISCIGDDIPCQFQWQDPKYYERNAWVSLRNAETQLLDVNFDKKIDLFKIDSENNYIFVYP